MHVRLTPRGRALGLMLGKASAWSLGFVVAIKTLAMGCHAVASAFSSSSPRPQYVPLTYTPIQNWAATYAPQPARASPAPVPQRRYTIGVANPFVMPQLTPTPNTIVMPQPTMATAQMQQRNTASTSQPVPTSQPVAQIDDVKKNANAEYQRFLQEREATGTAIARNRQEQAERIAKERCEQQAHQREESQRREEAARQQAAARNQGRQNQNRDGQQQSGR